MSIVKKLGVVLITTVGISFGVVGTALADMVIKADQILVPENDYLIFDPSHFGKSTICFQTTDQLQGFMRIMVMSSNYRSNLLVATPTEQFISESANMNTIFIMGMFRDLPDESKSIRVYVKE